jgi:hypothetical protein
VWVDTIHVEIDGWLIGLAVDSETALRTVERAFGGRLRRGLSGPVAYSLVGSADLERAGRRRLAALRHGRCPVLHARDVGLLVLVFGMSCRAHVVPRGFVPWAGSALVGTGGAVLAPGIVDQRIDHLRTELRRVGLSWVPGVRAFVDPATAELVVPDPGVEVDTRPAASDVPVAAPGRYPLRGWVTWRLGEGDATPAREVVLRFVQSLDPLTTWGDRDTFPQVIHLAATLPRRVVPMKLRDITAAAGSLLGR